MIQIFASSTVGRGSREANDNWNLILWLRRKPYVLGCTFKILIMTIFLAFVAFRARRRRLNVMIYIIVSWFSCPHVKVIWSHIFVCFMWSSISGCPRPTFPPKNLSKTRENNNELISSSENSLPTFLRHWYDSHYDVTAAHLKARARKTDYYRSSELQFLH